MDKTTFSGAPSRHMRATLNWDEFRLVKAIADSRSLVGASDLLSLNHSTVFRRLAALEAGVGVRLFERARTGYQPTAAGEEMIALAGSMADSIVEFERRVAGRDVKPTGELRITAFDSISVDVLPSILARFHDANPGVQVELSVSSHELNLARREADVALRATNGPTESLVGRRICTMRWSIYCTADFALRHGDGLLTTAPWTGFVEGGGPLSGRRWLEKYIHPRRQVFRVNTVLAIAEIVALGTAATILPCYIGDYNRGLIRIGEPQAELDVDLWLLTHADLRHSPRVRAFMDFASAELSRHRRRFEGDMRPM
jgi:DNA-binding transcriptional LysR family regulator